MNGDKVRMKKQILFVYLIFGVAVSNFSLDAQAATPELWVNGKRVSQVNIQVVADRRHLNAMFGRWLDTAAADLQRILPEFGVELSEDAPFLILVGGEVPTALQARAQQERYPDQASVIQVTDQAIHITSPNGRGLAKAVYTFLDRLGVRWYTPGKLGESLPMGKVELAEGAIVEGPDFMFRNFYWSRAHLYPSGYQEDLDIWYLRMRMDNEFGFSGHSYTEQIAPLKTYGDEHPEYYSLIGGKRVVSGAAHGRHDDHQLCVSNKAVQQLAIDFARKRFMKSKLHRFASISPNDGNVFCRCAGCREIGGASDHTVFLANVVGRAVQREFPDRFVAFYAYDGHLRTPKHRKLEPNVVPYIVNSHARLGQGEWKYYAAPIRSTAVGEVIKDWAGLGGRTAIRFNWSGTKYPHNWVSHIRDDFRFYLENKGVGAMAESTGNFVHVGWLNYWAGRVSWNVDLDIETEQAVLYRRFYGPGVGAATNVLASVVNRDLLVPDSPMPIEALEKNVELLRETVAGVSATPYRERLLHLLHYFEFLLAREEYLQGEKSPDAIDRAIRQMLDERSYAYQAKPGSYSHARLGKFEQVQKTRIDSWRDNQLVYRGKHTFAIKVEKPDKDIRYHLWYGSVGDRKNPMWLKLELPRGKLKGEVIYEKEVPVNTELDGSIPVPREGTYLLHVAMKDTNQFTLEIENPLFVVSAIERKEFHPFASARPAKNKEAFHSKGTPGFMTRYFYVPVHLNHFTFSVNGGGPTEWATFKVITPDDKVLLSKEKLIGKQDFAITVPPAIIGKIWRLEFRNGEDSAFYFSRQVPGWLASHPGRLIVPETYLHQ